MFPNLSHARWAQQIDNRVLGNLSEASGSLCAKEKMGSSCFILGEVALKGKNSIVSGSNKALGPPLSIASNSIRIGFLVPKRSSMMAVVTFLVDDLIRNTRQRFGCCSASHALQETPPLQVIIVVLSHQRFHDGQSYAFSVELWTFLANWVLSTHAELSLLTGNARSSCVLLKFCNHFFLHLSVFNSTLEWHHYASSLFGQGLNMKIPSLDPEVEIRQQWLIKAGQKIETEIFPIMLIVSDVDYARDHAKNRADSTS
ncbi:hypothetical protein VNO77_22591 [Canavalia gladiata]|uniref:Uncharacterized protein n=1 Tax=Canavalia gladiata TaxID=3824 RepID=A0AAN9L320_CANGL